MTTPERPVVIDVPSESGTVANGASAASAAGGQSTTKGPARRMDVVNLDAGFGDKTVIAGINLKIEPNAVTSLIGPSGAGKSTLLRCLNAMHSTAKGAFARGEILLDGVDINARGVDPVLVRRRVGMVFQRPNPFPTMSIYDNVAAGLRLTSGKRSGRHLHDEVVERALRQADLWSEVKDRLRSMGGALSGGQQQRLCIARALAVEPEVLLMDEPCSALDPISTSKIEETIHTLRATYTIVIVTHNMQQAARVSDTTAFMTILEAGQPGTLVETGPTSAIFGKPTNEVTGAYVSGRFG
ncbi:MAG TPA: phosphate ABC transporter ATP-binding protein [Gaiellales bacterium]|jgi:phosphate transport system ATP-binding protein|nr:phosphate ABC transporter ATP-binding protein [Gaiellales bacterium]